MASSTGIVLIVLFAVFAGTAISQSPTSSPTVSPVASPTVSPTASPTSAPTEAPLASPPAPPTADAPGMSPAMTPSISSAPGDAPASSTPNGGNLNRVGGGAVVILALAVAGLMVWVIAGNVACTAVVTDAGNEVDVRLEVLSFNELPSSVQSESMKKDSLFSEAILSE
ncbi:hypothetical protein Tco_1293757 [Tanacetum coccineum]